MNNCNYGVVKRVEVKEDTPTTSIEELFYILRTATKEEKILLLDELGILDELRSFIRDFINQNYTQYINELITNFGLNLTLTIQTQGQRIEELTQETNNKVSLSDIEISDINLTSNLELVSTNKLITVTNSNGDSQLFRLPLLDIVEFVYYTITYLNSPGTPTQRVKENTIVTLPTPTQTDKIFLGWIIDTPDTTGSCKYIVEENGTFGFKTTRNAYDNDNYRAYITSILVTGSINKIWDFTQLTWNKNLFGTENVSIGNTECTFAIGALEGLALQGGSNTNWVIDLNGLYQWNGNRIIGILNLNKGDIVTINTDSKLIEVYNGIGNINKIITTLKVTDNITLKGLWKDVPKAQYYLTNTIPTSVPTWSTSDGNLTTLQNLSGWDTWKDLITLYIVFPYKNSIDINSYFIHNDDYNASLTNTYIKIDSSISSIIVFKWNSRFSLGDSNKNNTVQIKLN